MQTRHPERNDTAPPMPAVAGRAANHPSAPAVRWPRLLLAAALLLGTATSRLAAVEGDRLPEGPVVAVPHCRVYAQECGLDPATPALSPAGCAMEFAQLLGRRGVTTRLVGETAVVCAPGSDTLVAEVTLTARCPAGADGDLPVARAKTVRVRAEVTLRDCATGEVVGRGRTKRQVEAGRHHLVRDLVEELGHHLSERKVRRAHSWTPIRWFGPDVGGERSIELLGGAIDVEEGGFGDLLEQAGMERAEYAERAALGTYYRPWHSPRVHVGFALEAMRIREEGTGDFDSDMLGLEDRGVALSGAEMKADLQVWGFNGTLGYGFDFTRNQRLSGILAVGYYLLGPTFARATIEIEGLPGGEIRLCDATVGGWVDLRYEWRLTPHLAVIASYGYSGIRFRRPNIEDNTRDFPVHVDYTGQTGRIGLAVRF